MRSVKWITRCNRILSVTKGKNSYRETRWFLIRREQIRFRQSRTLVRCIWLIHRIQRKIINNNKETDHVQVQTKETEIDTLKLETIKPLWSQYKGVHPPSRARRKCVQHIPRNFHRQRSRTCSNRK